MLTEERQDEIVRLVNVGGAVSVQALVEYFHISEATVRRDLVALQQAGRLRRVHGGATSLNGDNPLYEADMEELTHKYAFHMVEKRQIAQYASSLINDDDFVYLDAGSTVEQMADFLSESKAAFMTNNLPLATKLATNGCHVSILPGRIKGTTAAVVGADMIQSLKKYHLRKVFLARMAFLSTKAARRLMKRKRREKRLLSHNAQKRMFWQIQVNLVFFHVLPLLPFPQFPSSPPRAVMMSILWHTNIVRR